MVLRALAAPMPATNSAPTSISPTGSPFVYTNNTGRTICVLTSGGTVTTIEHSYNASVWLVVGLLAGWTCLRPGDSLRVTYTVAPTMNYIFL